MDISIQAMKRVPGNGRRSTNIIGTNEYCSKRKLQAKGKHRENKGTDKII